jgi:hypothetical protein
MPDRARASYKQAAERSEPGDAFWAWKAAQELPGSDQHAEKQKLESTLERMRNAADGSSVRGWWLYNEALLDRALGNTERAEAEFRETLLQSDELLTYHLTRLARSDGNTQ